MRQYTIYNKCPTPIDLYIVGVEGGAKDSTIPTNGKVVKSLDSRTTTFFTNANGGRLSREGTIRAVFRNDVSQNLLCYTYIVGRFLLLSSGLLLHSCGPQSCQHRSASEAQGSGIVTLSHKPFPFNYPNHSSSLRPMAFVRQLNATVVVVHKRFQRLRKISLSLHQWPPLLLTIGALFQTPIMI